MWCDPSLTPRDLACSPEDARWLRSRIRTVVDIARINMRMDQDRYNILDYFSEEPNTMRRGFIDAVRKQVTNKPARSGPFEAGRTEHA